LHYAARYGHHELAKVLLEHDADADAVVWIGGEECTPLDLAAWEE
jgi:ankyrin repeat protein